MNTKSNNNNNILKYTAIAVLGLLIILIFITAKSYTQLALAVTLYPFIVYLIFKVMPTQKVDQQIREPAVVTVKPVNTQETTVQNKVEITDIDKRTFLKLVGAAGLSFFVFSILGKRVESLLLGNALQSKIPELQNTETQVDSSSQIKNNEDFKISEIDDSGEATYYGFINKAGNWMIMKEDSESSSFRYAKGDSNFEKNWPNREKLKYDYFHNLF